MALPGDRRDTGRGRADELAAASIGSRRKRWLQRPVNAAGFVRRVRAQIHVGSQPHARSQSVANFRSSALNSHQADSMPSRVAQRPLRQCLSTIASEIRRVQPSEELRNRAVERESDRDDLAGGGISLPTLDPTNVVPVRLASAGERLLR